MSLPHRDRGGVVAVVVLVALCSTAAAADPPAAGPTPAVLEKQFVRARRTLEDHLRIGLDVRLVLSAGSAAERETTLFASELVASLRLADQAIVVDPKRFDDLIRRRLRSAKDADDLAFVVLLHELLHSYQAGVIDSRKSLPSRPWLRFLCEGHSIVHAESLARAASVSDDVLTAVRIGPLPRPTGVLEEDRPRVREQFHYRLSADYVKAQTAKLDEFDKLLGRSVAYPVVLGCDATKLRPSRFALLELTRLAATLKSFSLRPPQDVDYYETALLLCPPAFDDRSLCQAFRGGAVTGCLLADDTSADVVLLHFDGEASQAFGVRLKEYALLAARPQRREWVEPGAGTFRVANFPAAGQTLHGRVSGSVVALVAVTTIGPGADFVRTVFGELPTRGEP